MSKYIITPGGDIPTNVRNLAHDIQKSFNQISADVSRASSRLTALEDAVIPTYAVADLPTDGSVNIALVSDDSTLSATVGDILAFFVPDSPSYGLNVWVRANDFTEVT